jgi:hypothetical protein
MMPGQGGTSATLVGQPVPGLVADQGQTISQVRLRAKSTLSAEWLPLTVSNNRQ